MLFILFFFLLERPVQKSLRVRRFKSDGDEKIGRIVLQANTDRLVGLIGGPDFRFDVTHSRWQPWHNFTQKSAATWWVNTKRLPGAYAAAYASSCSLGHSHFFVLWPSVWKHILWTFLFFDFGLWRKTVGCDPSPKRFNNFLTRDSNGSYLQTLYGNITEFIFLHPYVSDFCMLYDNWLCFRLAYGSQCRWDVSVSLLSKKHAVKRLHDVDRISLNFTLSQHGRL